MHGIDEQSPLRRVQARRSYASPDPSPRPRLQPRAAAEAHISTEKLVPYAVSEEHERGQLADKRSDTTPGLDAVGRRSGPRPGGVPGLADRHQRDRCVLLCHDQPRRARCADLGVWTVGLWSGTVVSSWGWWLGRSAPSPLAVASLLHGAHSGCE